MNPTLYLIPGATEPPAGPVKLAQDTIYSTSTVPAGGMKLAKGAVVWTAEQAWPKEKP